MIYWLLSTLPKYEILLVDMNEFPSIFFKVHLSSFSLQTDTTSNFLRITLKGSMRVSNEWSLEEAISVYKPTCMYGKIIQICLLLLLEISQNIDGFRQNNSQDF